MFKLNSQKGRIMKWMQNHPTEIITASDFMSFLNLKPFIWFECNSRLSELKKAWYVEIVWTIKNKTWNNKNRRWRLLFRLTNKWKNLELK